MALQKQDLANGISIHALLAESDDFSKHVNISYAISIHALLAESDSPTDPRQTEYQHFYPRSPCGERRDRLRGYPPGVPISIHALLAESDGSTSSAPATA